MSDNVQDLEASDIISVKKISIAGKHKHTGGSETMSENQRKLIDVDAIKVSHPSQLTSPKQKQEVEAKAAAAELNAAVDREKSKFSQTQPLTRATAPQGIGFVQNNDVAVPLRKK